MVSLSSLRGVVWCFARQSFCTASSWVTCNSLTYPLNASDNKQSGNSPCSGNVFSFVDRLSCCYLCYEPRKLCVRQSHKDCCDTNDLCPDYSKCHLIWFCVLRSSLSDVLWSAFSTLKFTINGTTFFAWHTTGILPVVQLYRQSTWNVHNRKSQKLQ